MTTPIVICDDSGLARKQMARALPEEWLVDISYAENGDMALDHIRQGRGKVVFLDLNMPVRDGYQTLQVIQDENLPCMVIVVSGDVQPEAMQRVKKLGALEFIKKPVDSELLRTIINNYGLMMHDTGAPQTKPEPEVGLMDCYQEIMNVAMGRAGDLLARLLGAFIELPIPRVNHLAVNELAMALQFTSEEEVSAVCQGFIGFGVAGEALLIFPDASFPDIARLMKYKGDIDERVEIELLIDVSSVLIGACLNGLSEQLDIGFSQNYPVVLGQHTQVSDLVKAGAKRWRETLAIEITYRIENFNINCDLLLLFSEDSIERLNELVAYFAE